MKIIEPIRNPDRFNINLDIKEVDEAINDVVRKVKHNIIKLGETFPTPNTINGSYLTSKNKEWTTGFWTGILWLCYENTHDDRFRELAEKNVNSFLVRIKEKIDVDNHDLGFMYIPSCVAAYKLTGNQEAKEAALLASKQLASRYNEKGKFIQAWGKQGAKDNYRLIVDALMNIPLLHWAAKEVNNSEYEMMANNHFESTLRYAVRENGSAFHTFYFDPKTGKALYGKTRQGYSDDSSWARGQAWLLYGIPLNYLYAANQEESLDIYEAVTNYFINRLPEDFIPYWDLIFGDGDLQSRDSSAGAIAACGLNQILRNNVNFKELKVYRNVQKAILKSLIEKYSKQETNGIIPLLNHSVYSWHSGKGIDEGTIWGDYFYLEALTRYRKNWKMYW